jgi:hypothetical protein
MAAYFRTCFIRLVGSFTVKCQVGFAWLDRPFSRRLFEIAIRLTRRDGAVPRQLPDGCGKLIDLPQQVDSQLFGAPPVREISKATAAR